MISLAGITLNSSMIWKDRFDTFGVGQTVKRSLGGVLFIDTAKVLTGRPITLEASEDYGWLTVAQVEALRALADQEDFSGVLLLDGVSYTVGFRHHEPPALSFQPIVPRENQQSLDYLTGTIKLMTL